MCNNFCCGCGEIYGAFPWSVIDCCSDDYAGRVFCREGRGDCLYLCFDFLQWFVVCFSHGADSSPREVTDRRKLGLFNCSSMVPKCFALFQCLVISEAVDENTHAVNISGNYPAVLSKMLRKEAKRGIEWIETTLRSPSWAGDQLAGDNTSWGGLEAVEGTYHFPGSAIVHCPQWTFEPAKSRPF